MMTRRDAAIGLFAGLVALEFASVSAGAQETLSEADALAIMQPWLDALFIGDPAQVAMVLAPEYQILRSNGVGYNKADYLKALPKKTKKTVVSQVNATSNGQIMVARYLSETEQTIEGVAVNGTSPRLSVFRKEGDAWLTVAHANFAHLT